MIEFGELPIEIVIAALEDRALFAGTHPSSSVFPVAGIDLIYDVHSRDYLADRSETFAIKPGVVDQIDIDLARSSVGTGHRKSDVASQIARLYRIISYGLISPHRCDGRIARDPELHDIACAHPKEPGVVEETRSDQVVEPIRAPWRPG